MKRLHLVSVVAAALSCAVPCGFAPSAMAQETSTDVLAAQLAEMLPDATKEGILEKAEQAAQANGVSTEVMLERALKQTVENADQIAQFTGKRRGDRSSSTGSATLHITPALRKGDIFWSPQLPVQHVGIFVEKNYVVDAQGGKKKSSRRHYSSVTVAKRGELLVVNTSQANRDKAAQRALKYTGRPYPNNSHDMAFNKNEGPTMNCSQLVWASYYYSTGIDLSSASWTPGVYPWDIQTSRWTTPYKEF